MWYLLCCSAMRTRFNCAMAFLFGLSSGTLPTYIGDRVRFRARSGGEQVELLEHHAHVLADVVDGLHVVGSSTPSTMRWPSWMFLQPVDAADHRWIA